MVIAVQECILDLTHEFVKPHHALPDCLLKRLWVLRLDCTLQFPKPRILFIQNRVVPVEMSFNRPIGRNTPCLPQHDSRGDIGTLDRHTLVHIPDFACCKFTLCCDEHSKIRIRSIFILCDRTVNGNPEDVTPEFFENFLFQLVRNTKPGSAAHTRIIVTIQSLSIRWILVVLYRFIILLINKMIKHENWYAGDCVTMV